MNFTEQIPQNSTFYKILLMCAFTAAIGVLTVVSSCKSTEKRQAKMYGKFDKLKRKADADSVLKVVPSKWSLDNFPVTVGKGKTTFLPGRTITKHDTITDTKTVKDTVYVTKTITKHHYQTDTFATTDTILDNRPLKQLQTEIGQVNAKATQYKANEQIAKDKLQKRTGVMWWLIAALVVLILWTFRRLFGFIR